jgi:hypothetical protein
LTVSRPLSLPLSPPLPPSLTISPSRSIRAGGFGFGV